MLRVVFCGSPEFASVSLLKLLKSPCTVSAVVTMPDRKQGRGQALKVNPVKVVALENNLEILQPDKATDPSFLEKLKQIQPDIILVVAYGKILRKSFIDIPKYCCINLHASLLPNYRGAAPIHWALLRGDKETGVSTFVINEGMDTGDIILDQEVDIDPDDTLGTLHDKLAKKGALLLWDTVKLFESGMPSVRPQSGNNVFYAKKISREISSVDWSRSSEEIHNLVRAMNPVPGASSFVDIRGKKKVIKLFKTSFSEENLLRVPGEIVKVNKESFTVSCGKGSVIVKELQMEGKKVMSTGDFLRGYPLEAGKKFIK